MMLFLIIELILVCRISLELVLLNRNLLLRHIYCKMNLMFQKMQ